MKTYGKHRGIDDERKTLDGNECDQRMPTVIPLAIDGWNANAQIPVDCHIDEPENAAQVSGHERDHEVT